MGKIFSKLLASTLSFLVAPQCDAAHRLPDTALDPKIKFYFLKRQKRSENEYSNKTFNYEFQNKKVELINDFSFKYNT